jgi:Xaa-Pro aminopeptidase
MADNKINNSFFKKNRTKLFSLLPEKSLAIVHSNDEMPRNGDQFFKFRQHSDLFYLSGIEHTKTILALCNNHPDKNYREILIATKPNDAYFIWYGHQPDKDELRKLSGIQTIIWLEDFEVILKELIFYSVNIYLNSNEYIKLIPDFKDRNHRFALELKEKFPLHQYYRLAPFISELRLIKEKEEIELIKEACAITSKAFYRILKFIKPDVYEYEIEAELSHEFTVNKSGGHAYHPIVASGLNACILHYTENDVICKDGDLLLIDFGAEFGNYASDCTRTIPVNGRFSERQKSCYQAVLNVQKKAMELFTIGNTIDNLNAEVNKLIENELILLGLFSREDVNNQNPETPLFKNYYMHGVAHFIGLDVHDVGSKQSVFEEGMVVSCEPGIYIREEKIGIRIENDILITKDGPINLMKNIPVEIDEIENLMKK